ncbi:long-chain fatty acid--CoA ligase [Stagnimonas aquatica]|uniref:Long-chain fatty acid--CoA ligase n=1 Tax=Stagnimonas aquatica TaxID=2689987 RepID=A0A3N0VKB9_9GAMM|nr:AMP-binding protein [Stagnimonas aquatica]ROH93209.1 long-chain fatty acid--CoA ligase [Stagnimonas aquatica]
MAIARESLSLIEAPLAGIAESEIDSVAALFDARVRLTPQGAACRWFDAEARDWRSLDWAGLDARVEAFARGLAAQALEPGARVAIQLDNGPDWVAAEQAIHRLGLVAVGIYVQDTVGSAAHILQDSGASLVFLREAAAWEALRAQAPLPALRQAVIQRGPAEGERSATLAGFLGAGVDYRRPPADREALAGLVYTSGTTGRARGAMLSHGALLANVFACARALRMRADDRLLSLLPLSHSFERVAGWHGAVLAGAETAYSRGPEHLAEDLRLLRPTGMLAVPRVYERLYARLLRGVDDGPLHKRALFHLAVQSAGIPSGSARQRFSRRLTGGVIEAVRAGLGGRLRMAISGGAPLSAHIARSFAALGLPVLQGYGLTEAGPVVSVNRPGDADPESAGAPLDNVETRIGPDGELWVRSPSLMRGYWHDEAATRAVLDEAGWLHTGDKVSRLCCDKLYLTGRIKDILVMSTGVKAAPCEIEARLCAEPLFEQAVVLGESRPYLIALVVPDANRFAALRQSLGLPAGFDDAETRAALEKALFNLCREKLADLPASHQILRLAWVPPFTLANGQLTSTHKARRGVIAKVHAAEVERLYAGHCGSHVTDCSRNAEVR